MPYETTRPTDVSVVLAYLTALDDFANRMMIHAATAIPMNRIRPALAHLKNHSCIDCMIVNGNELWFWATPASDDRKIIRKKSPNGLTRTEKGRRAPAKRAPRMR
jgi:hypothetical protein